MDAAIRATLELAKQHEERTQSLYRYLCVARNHLHPAILLPKGGSVEALVDFVVKYIEQIPDLVAQAQHLAAQRGLEQHIHPIAHTIIDLFINPPSLLDDVFGLGELMLEAYLAHRLLEEINDNYVVKFGQPLLPVDMTVSNSIMHHLIGDELGEQLDQLVADIFDELKDNHLDFMDAEAPLVNAVNSDSWQKNWRCFTDSASVALLHKSA